MKRNLLGTTAVVVVGIPCGSFTVNAGTRNKHTKMTFSHPVRVPGATLPVGSTYIFKLVDSHANRRIVRITNEAGDKAYATILAIPDYRHKATSHTVVEFGEASGASPTPIKAWFYPGDTHGFRFVYPREEAQEIASTYKEPVPEEQKVALQEAENATNASLDRRSSQQRNALYGSVCLFRWSPLPTWPRHRGPCRQGLATGQKMRLR